MRVVLLRVGIDTGSGGIHGPLYEDGSFELIPIPDGFQLDKRTYGNTTGRHGMPLSEYFPERKQQEISAQSMHVDPEFDEFTYGDPTRPKAGLRRLEAGDLLVFYCGLKGWDFESEPALYLCGFFEVLTAGYASDFREKQLEQLFGANFHVRHERVFTDQKERLVLVKGTPDSRLLEKAVLLSEYGQDRAGRRLKILSTRMREIFGDFGGKLSLQRSPPRWVDADSVERAAEFIRSLS